MSIYRVFATGLLLALAGCSSGVPQPRTDVPEQGFCKDLFLDSGIKIFNYPPMPAALWLGLDTELLSLEEEFTPENLERQRRVIVGGPEDLNGRLLYPDGAPRFKAMYVYGGLATLHGKSLGPEGLDRIRAFFRSGGSYVGSCAGAYLAGAGINVDNYKEDYLGIWPLCSDEAVVEDIYPEYIIPGDSPLLRYYDFGGDGRVDSVKHWNGPVFDLCDSVPGTEVLARNHLEGSILDGRVSVIAYKPSVQTGRLVISGGHPENYPDGERRCLMAAMLRYAMDGCGCARVKAVLENGVPREMTRTTADNDPAFTMIGDGQCHHFLLHPDGRVHNVKIRLESLSGHPLSLRLAEGTFAFEGSAAFTAEGSGAVKEISLKKLRRGDWYICVQNEERVTDYASSDLLNGIPYIITASWE